MCYIVDLHFASPPPRALLALRVPPSSHHNFRSRGHNGYVLPLQAVRSLARYPCCGCGSASGILALLASTPTRARSVGFARAWFSNIAPAHISASANLCRTPDWTKHREYRRDEHEKLLDFPSIFQISHKIIN